MKAVSLTIVAVVLAGAVWAARGAESGTGAPKFKPERVTVVGEGGLKLVGFYVAPPAKAAKGRCPAVVLTHMLGQKKEDWLPLLGPLHRAGFAVLAYDVRGHGKSVEAGKTKSPGKMTAEDWKPAEKDLAKVVAWLLAGKKDVVDPKRVALCGGSIGANLSLKALAADTRLRGAVLLSAGLNYRGIRTAAAAGRLAEDQKLAIFATRKDSRGYCAKTAEDLAKAAGEKRLIVKKVYDGSEHGTRMFGKIKGVEAEVVKALSTMTAPVKKKVPKGDDVKKALDRIL
jgi:pimeloyl-ACP methyl ester carboxylesterase